MGLGEPEELGGRDADMVKLPVPDAEGSAEVDAVVLPDLVALCAAVTDAAPVAERRALEETEAPGDTLLEPDREDAPVCVAQALGAPLCVASNEALPREDPDAVEVLDTLGEGDRVPLELGGADAERAAEALWGAVSEKLALDTALAEAAPDPLAMEEPVKELVLDVLGEDESVPEDDGGADADDAAEPLLTSEELGSAVAENNGVPVGSIGEGEAVEDAAIEADCATVPPLVDDHVGGALSLTVAALDALPLGPGEGDTVAPPLSEGAPVGAAEPDPVAEGAPDEDCKGDPLAEGGGVADAEPAALGDTAAVPFGEALNCGVGVATPLSDALKVAFAEPKGEGVSPLDGEEATEGAAAPLGEGEPELLPAA